MRRSPPTTLRVVPGGPQGDTTALIEALSLMIADDLRLRVARYEARILAQGGQRGRAVDQWKVELPPRERLLEPAERARMVAGDGVNDRAQVVHDGRRVGRWVGVHQAEDGLPNRRIAPGSHDG